MLIKNEEQSVKNDLITALFLTPVCVMCCILGYILLTCKDVIDGFHNLLEENIIGFFMAIFFGLVILAFPIVCIFVIINCIIKFFVARTEVSAQTLKSVEFLDNYLAFRFVDSSLNFQCPYEYIEILKVKGETSTFTLQKKYGPSQTVTMVHRVFLTFYFKELDSRIHAKSKTIVIVFNHFLGGSKNFYNNIKPYLRKFNNVEENLKDLELN